MSVSRTQTLQAVDDHCIQDDIDGHRSVFEPTSRKVLCLDKSVMSHRLDGNGDVTTPQ